MNIGSLLNSEARRADTLYLTRNGVEMAHGTPIADALIRLYEVANQNMLAPFYLAQVSGAIDDVGLALEDALRPDAE